MAVLLAAAVSIGACSDDNNGTGPNDDGENQDAATVTATVGQAFTPNSVNIITGGLVTWVFQSLEHNVTFNATEGAPVDIAPSSNTSTSRSFPTAGVFSYQCTIHPGMTGTVRVGQ